MRCEARSVEDYLSQLSPGEASELGILARKLRQALPDAVETLQWGMPAWLRPDGTMLAGLAAQKRHLAFYLCPELGEDPYADWRDHLPKSAMGKGCLRFSRLDQLPSGMVDALIARIAASA